MNARKRILVVSPRFLFPADEGGKIRTANILRHMRGGTFEITLASPRVDNIESFAEDIAKVSDRFVSWPAQASRRLRQFFALVDSEPVAVSTGRSRPAISVLQEELRKEPDVLLVDFPHAAVLLPGGHMPKSLIFTHNVEAEIFERHANVANPVWRAIWRNQARKMRRFEGATLRRFDQVIAVSERDAEALKRNYGLNRVARVDTGVDLEFHRFVPPVVRPPVDGGSIVFCGAMDWRANVDGVKFLLDEVWPLVLRARPAARAVIVGRNPPSTLITEAGAKGHSWQFTGYVDDVRPYVESSDVYVIPLRVGSGTRIKAYEALAAGRPLVSTALGVEGLDVTPDLHYLRADQAPDFADAIIRLLDDDGLRLRLATAARSLLEERFSWAHVARQFEDICLNALNTPQRQ